MSSTSRFSSESAYIGSLRAGGTGSSSCVCNSSSSSLGVSTEHNSQVVA